MIRMDRNEAVRTIQSLAAQLASGNPNSERYECICEDGTDFSIAVHVNGMPEQEATK